MSEKIEVMEALSELQDILEHNAVTGMKTLDKKHWDLIKKAVDRDVPTVPHILWSVYDEIGDAVCRVCDDHHPSEQSKFCAMCGQRLEWRVKR